MRSKLRIDCDSSTNEPIIVVELISTDDLRDKFLKMFFEKLGEGQELSVRCVGDITDGARWEIRNMKEDAAGLGRSLESWGCIRASANQIAPATNNYFNTTYTGTFHPNPTMKDDD